MAMPGAEQKRILVIEDHADIAQILEHHLTREGYDVTVAEDGEKGLEQVNQKKPDLVLLDLMLPKMDGLTVCQTLREKEATRSLPVVMVTAKGEEEDIVAGLNLGADDYLTKPFSPMELLARVKAVLRRSGLRKSASNQDVIRVDDIEVDSIRHEVTVGKEKIQLTLAEFKLLRVLASSPGRVFTRDQLIDRVRGSDVTIIDRNIDVHIAALRKKLKAGGTYIVTIRGVGYKFREES